MCRERTVPVNRLHAGFSTVELMVTLFVVGAFLVAGYQLYGIVVRSSAEAQQTATASNIAYDAVRRHSANVGVTCNAPGFEGVGTTPIEPSILPLAELTIETSCPRGTSSSLTRVKATVTFGTPERKVVHASDVTRYE